METIVLNDIKFSLLNLLGNYTNNFTNCELLENFLDGIGVFTIHELMDKFSEMELIEISAYLDLKIKINGKGKRFSK